ncbi:MAG TPA: CHRD domain-containing protein [Burkholderiales bacterium]|nr:CHRD domain-containing protein [Burkholderiales bacterium]
MTLAQKAVSVVSVLALMACATMAGKNVDVTLSGAEEVPPVSTPARGGGSFTIGDDGSVSGSVTTSGVEGTMAHIHQGARGQNGPVIVPLTKNGNTYSAPAGAKLNEAQMAAFKAGNLYVNVHSAANKGGEVRGQLNP